ncbi:LysR family transcriptional regulator [Uniformispora flossi]|uniref:LysR family transcriptional regulator n=1 Tax=Uniformispora flossi TaxID=3390723 RepID=UPI003C2B49C6
MQEPHASGRTADAARPTPAADGPLVRAHAEPAADAGTARTAADPVAHDFSTAWLRVFLAVAEAASFTAAAARLGYTQSAVSRQISALEDEVGSPLFDRLPRGVRLTDAGHALLPRARAVLDQVDLARRDLAELRGLARGRVRVGAFATAGAALVPRAIAGFLADHPGVGLTLDEDLTPRLLAAVAADELDVAVVSGPAGHSPDADLHHLLDEVMLVALPRTHPLAGRRRVRLAELAAESWIAGGRRPEQTLLGPYLRPDFVPRIGFVASDWIAKQGLVAAGLGVTLVPALAAGALRADLAVCALDADEVPVRAVHAATHRGVAPSAATAAFLGQLRAAARTLSAELAALA